MTRQATGWLRQASSKMVHQTNKKGGERWAEVQVGPPAAQNPDGADVPCKLKKENSCLEVAQKFKDNLKKKEKLQEDLPRRPNVLIIGIQTPSNQKAQLILN